jgi:hypothetical protein
LESVDALSATDNGEGLILIDAEAGWPYPLRIICLLNEGPRSSCSSDAAAVVIDDHRHPGQVFSRWRKNDPKTVEVFVFGARIERCIPRSAGVHIVLRQLPLSQMPSIDSWSEATTRMFAELPDRCATTP